MDIAKSTLVSLVLFCALTTAAQQSRTINEQPRWHSTPVNNQQMNARLAEYADQVAATGPIERVTFYDVGYPQSVEEFSKLDGNGILMVTSLSQTKSVFPFKRMYAKVGSDVYELKLIKDVLSQNAENSKIAKVLGTYRSDALYLFAFFIRLQTGSSVWADPANGGPPIQIAVFSSPVAQSIKFLPNEKPTGKGPDSSFLDLFLKREYPAFFEKKP